MDSLKFRLIFLWIIRWTQIQLVSSSIIIQLLFLRLIAFYFTQSYPYDGFKKSNRLLQLLREREKQRIHLSLVVLCLHSIVSFRLLFSPFQQRKQKIDFIHPDTATNTKYYTIKITHKFLYYFSLFFRNNHWNGPTTMTKRRIWVKNLRLNKIPSFAFATFSALSRTTRFLSLSL